MEVIEEQLRDSNGMFLACRMRNAQASALELIGLGQGASMPYMSRRSLRGKRGRQVSGRVSQSMHSCLTSVIVCSCLFKHELRSCKLGPVCFSYYLCPQVSGCELRVCVCVETLVSEVTVLCELARMCRGFWIHATGAPEERWPTQMRWGGRSRIYDERSSAKL